MINNKKILSVVLARAGSEGIKQKNVRELCGKPLFMWSVLTSLYSQYVDMTVVSSNCDITKNHFFSYIGKDYQIYQQDGKNYVDDKLNWVPRPYQISTSTSKNEEALIHAVNYLKDTYNLSYDIVITLQPTSPNRQGKLLDRCIEEYENGQCDSLITGKKFTPFLWKKIGGKWVYDVDNNDCCNRKMRQDFIDRKDYSEFLWHDCGSIYMTDKKVLLKTGCRIGKNPCIFTVDGMNALQIDEEYDFQLIENMVKAYELKSLI